MANKPLLGTITVLIGLASLSGYIASGLFTDNLVGNDAAVANNDMTAEQTDVEPYIEGDQLIEPDITDEQATGVDTELQAAEESDTAQYPGSGPPTALEEADTRSIAEEEGMVATPHGDGLDVGPSDE